MDLMNQIQQITKTYSEHKDSITTEEAAKLYLVVPFLRALGYDASNPSEVVPELTADIPGKKGEKVDFAIKQDGKITMIVECKCCDVDLAKEHKDQLMHYFPHVLDARLGILTNGLEYQVYTDTKEKNILDTKPFFQFDIRTIKPSDIKTLEQFCKPNFNVDGILDSAMELKYTGEIKRYIAEQFSNPDDAFTKCIIKGIEYPGTIWATVLQEFKNYSKNALHLFLNEKINERLASAAIKEDEKLVAEEESVIDQITPDKSVIVTTPEELEAFRIIKAIMHRYIDVNRIFMRDAKTYCPILIDDKNYQTLCRLYFNNPNSLQLGLVDDNKNINKVKIESLNDIYSFEDNLVKTLEMYTSQKEG